MQTNFLDNLDAPHNGKATSKAAAESIVSAAQTIRTEIYDFIRAQPDGATRQEIERALGIAGDTVRPRVWELMKARLVVESERTRKTTSGRDAFILFAKGSE